MTSTVQAPALDAQADGVQQIQDVPLWTESFHGSGYDPEQRLGVFVHVARAQFDPELWDETCVVFLPDGRFAVHRGFAYGDTPEGPAANAVTYVYRKPFEEWDLRFRGSVRVVTAEELAANTLADGVHVGAELDLTLRALGPAFGIGGMGQEFWAHGHYEQHIGLRGSVVVEHGPYAPLQGELDCRSWREDPSPVERLREQYRGQTESQSPERSHAARTAERARARDEVTARLPRHKRARAAAVFKLAAGAIPLCGTGKAASLRAIDVGRAAARRIGMHLVDTGAPPTRADVFYLTVEEIVDGSATSLSDVVAKRRAIRDDYLGLTIPAYWRGRPEPTVMRTGPTGSESVRIEACGASSGVLEAPVRVLLDPFADDFEPGEILVAPFTDPGWASVMFLAGALVVDIGGLQSHAAVIARELGIPCVMGTVDGTVRLRTGDVCRVDGGAGTVELVRACGDP